MRRIIGFHTSHSSVDEFELLSEMPEELSVSSAYEVREKLSSIFGGDVLEVCTDDGDFIKVVVKTLRDNRSFTGIDISGESLVKARKRLNNARVNFVAMNAEAMTFQDNQFDAVCASYTIHHLEHIDAVLAEMYRVLKPGGALIIQEMYSDGEQTLAQIVDRDIHHFQAKVDRLVGIPHYETLPRQRLRRFVNELGLRHMEVFESSWAVKCLFCNDSEKCVDPHNKDSFDSQIATIDEGLAKIREHVSYNEMKEEAETLRNRLKAEGSSEASTIYFFGTK
jgi:ubiquinone/menaquinone biosynthesis C-methylase UbiE